MKHLSQLRRNLVSRIRDRRAYTGLKPHTEYLRGSEDWLRAAERHFGGISRSVERRRVSENDKRTMDELKKGGMVGGDRMSHHGYAKHYAKHLSQFLTEDSPKIIVEVGILRGTGLALWSLLFPRATIIGMDIDPSHFRENEPNLRAKGAFADTDPHILVFDQLEPDTAELETLLDGKKIDILIDDGLHTDEAVMNTLDALRPFLAEQFVFFVEDNVTVGEKISDRFPELQLFTYGELSVAER